MSPALVLPCWPESYGTADILRAVVRTPYNTTGPRLPAPASVRSAWSLLVRTKMLHHPCSWLNFAPSPDTPWRRLDPISMGPIPRFSAIYQEPRYISSWGASDRARHTCSTSTILSGIYSVPAEATGLTLESQ